MERGKISLIILISEIHDYVSQKKNSIMESLNIYFVKLRHYQENKD